MAVGPLLKSTCKMFKPSGLKKSFLSATDSGKSERVGASMPTMTFVASAQRLSCGTKKEISTKIERTMRREFFSSKSPLPAATRHVTDRQFIEGRISCQADDSYLGFDVSGELRLNLLTSVS